MTWLDQGEWGPTGDPAVDFPPESPRGQLFNPENERSNRLSGRDAAVVAEASRAADAWLHTSQFKVGMGEYVVSLPREGAHFFTLLALAK